MAVGFNFAPRGWALCNGQLLSISQNTALFSLFGTTYGGDGKTNFALPNLQSRVPLQAGQGPGLSNYDLGEQLGVESVTLALRELAAHTHQANAFGRGGDSTSPAGNNWASGGAINDNWYSPSANGPTAPVATSLTGGNLPHENRQPYLVLNFIVALEGIFPSRN
jgi:microcystin-dependent protein